MQNRFRWLRRLLCASLLFTGLAQAAAPAKIDLSSLDLEQRLNYHRAIEAGVWAMPLMNFKAMRDAGRRGGVGRFDIGYFSQTPNWKYQIATPNDTTPYVIFFWDLSQGPVVVDMPASNGNIGVFGTLMDAWQRPLEDVGAKGIDQGKGGKYLIVPAGYKEPVPADMVVLEQNTFNGYGLLRQLMPVASTDNLAKASELVKQIRIYPLTKPTHQNQYVDIFDKPFDAITAFDSSLYQHLHEILQEETIENRDLTMYSLLNQIGIGKGKRFEPSQAQRELLDAAAEETHQYLLSRYHQTTLENPFYPGTHWAFAALPGGIQTTFSYEVPGHLEYHNRGAQFYATCTTVKRLGKASFYLAAAQDKQGQWMNGGEHYRLNVPAGVPVENFWSVVVYDLESAAWIRQSTKVGLDSSEPALQANTDGSVDIYFGPEAPAGKEANWIPTQAGKRFFLLFRFYGPTADVFEKNWTMGDVEKTPVRL